MLQVLVQTPKQRKKEVKSKILYCCFFFSWKFDLRSLDRSTSFHAEVLSAPRLGMWSFIRDPETLLKRHIFLSREKKSEHGGAK